MEYLRSVIQQNYAILRLRSALRKLESECLFCRRRREQNLQPQKADLPIEHLAYKKPAFNNTPLPASQPESSTRVLPTSSSILVIDRFEAQNQVDLIFSGRTVKPTFSVPAPDLESLIKSCKRIRFTVPESGKVKKEVLSTSLCLEE